MKKVLVVEDDMNNMRLITKLLENDGFSIIKAETGEEGVARAVADLPDIILMDIKLPGIDGLEATRRIRTSGCHSKTPIIAITSYAMAGDREKYLKEGFTGYIEKPIDPFTIMKEINEIWKKNI
jgi:CheY-like chemotaxis protein